MSLTQLIGDSSWTQSLRAKILQVAAFSSNVLVTGPSGTGKELIARAIHHHSPRAAHPFIPVDCTSLTGDLFASHLFGHVKGAFTGGDYERLGCFRAAEGGTILLDEIGEMSLDLQSKLLRAIQDLAIERVGGTGARRVDTRIVVATNRPLSTLAARGLFRPDLYYRLSGVDIQVPPLRERREDIPELVAYFLNRHRSARDLSLADGAMDALRLHDWPGNVRELERVIERVVALARTDRIDLDDLPPHVRGQYGEVLAPALAARDSMRAWASRYARLVFERCGRNKRQASRLLDISYHTLDAYLRYGSAQSRPLTKRVPAWAREEPCEPLAVAPPEAT